MPIIAWSDKLRNLVEYDRRIACLRFYSEGIALAKQCAFVESGVTVEFSADLFTAYHKFFLSPPYSLLIPGFPKVWLEYKIGRAKKYERGIVTLPGAYEIELRNMWSLGPSRLDVSLDRLDNLSIGLDRSLWGYEYMILLKLFPAFLL